MIIIVASAKPNSNQFMFFKARVSTLMVPITPLASDPAKVFASLRISASVVFLPCTTVFSKCSMVLKSSLTSSQEEFE